MQWKDKAGDFEQPPLGLHVARCVWLIDMGTQKNMFGTDNRNVLIKWELPLEKNSKGEVHEVSGWYTQSLHPKANLYHMLTSWRGCEFTPEESKGFDPRVILGKACMVNIMEKPLKEGGVKHAISTVVQLAKGTTCPPQITPSLYLSLEPNQFDAPTFGKLSDTLQEKIKATPEWRALQSGPEDQSGGEPPWTDDDVPF